jgi:muramoyltetrapeptide carboxypeptidase
MKTRIPPYLKQGDTIAITAPAGYMPFENMQTCLDVLQEWGYTVKLGDTTHSSSENYFSGTDAERARDLQQFLDDDEVSAILCARGGYGLSRIIPMLDFKKFRRKPKWIIGYSDVTVLHAYLLRQYGIASLHSPMAAAFNEKESNDPYLNSLRKALSGEKMSYECMDHPFNKKGTAKGMLVGGNLSLLAHLCGSGWDFKTKKRILFLEDVGEQLYNVDRMLIQLKNAGKFSSPAAVIIGGFTDPKDTTRPFGKQVYEIIRDQLAGLDCPVCFGFPVSHENENYALKTGVVHRLTVNGEKTLLEEL